MFAFIISIFSIFCISFCGISNPLINNSSHPNNSNSCSSFCFISLINTISSSFSISFSGLLIWFISILSTNTILLFPFLLISSNNILSLTSFINSYFFSGFFFSIISIFSPCSIKIFSSSNFLGSTILMLSKYCIFSSGFSFPSIIKESPWFLIKGCFSFILGLINIDSLASIWFSGFAISFNSILSFNWILFSSLGLASINILSILLFDNASFCFEGIYIDSFASIWLAGLCIWDILKLSIICAILSGYGFLSIKILSANKGLSLSFSFSLGSINISFIFSMILFSCFLFLKISIFSTFSITYTLFSVESINILSIDSSLFFWDFLFPNKHILSLTSAI